MFSEIGIKQPAVAENLSNISVAMVTRLTGIPRWSLSMSINFISN